MTRANIAKARANCEKAPTTLVPLKKQTTALMNTRTDLSCIRSETIQYLSPLANKRQTTTQSDVNGNSKSARSVVRITLCGVKLKHHITPSLQNAVFVGGMPSKLYTV
jgi:hypothetical protein